MIGWIQAVAGAVVLSVLIGGFWLTVADWLRLRHKRKMKEMEQKHELTEKQFEEEYE